MTIAVDMGRKATKTNKQKVKYHLISITKSVSKIFLPNFVFVLTNERYQTYQTGFYRVPTIREKSVKNGKISRSGKSQGILS